MEYSGSFSFTVDLINGKLIIEDTYGYVANGESSSATVFGYVKKIYSPNGMILSDNPISDGSPDINFDLDDIGVNKKKIFDIPTYEDGTYQVGNYVVEYESVVSISSNNYVKNSSFQYLGFDKPEASLDIDADCVTPLFKVSDSTDYKQSKYGDKEPDASTSPRLITIDFPKTGVANLTGTAATLETATFYTTNQQVTLTRTLNYIIETNFFIKDSIALVKDEYVVCVAELCALSALVDTLNAKYEAARKVSTIEAEIAFKKWITAGVLLVEIREALSCGDKDGLNSYAEQIKQLAGDCNCGCGGDSDEAILITGMSVFDNNDVVVGYAIDTDGTDLAFEPFDTYQYFAFLPKNKKYTPVAEDFDGLWQAKPSGGGGELVENVTTTIAVGASEANTTIPIGTTFTEYVKLIHQKIFYPTFVNPTFSLSRSASSLQKIASEVSFTLTFNFNRGSILGKLVGGVWQPSTEQDKRTGLATSYTIDGTTQSGNTLAVSKVISLGVNTYSGTVSYAVGVQPTDSIGEDYDSPYPSGTSSAQTTTIEGVYPLFATTASISTATEQALVSMISGNNIQKTLVAESGGNKQFFDIPDAWLSSRSITSVQFYNSVSGSFDTTNQLSTFTQTAVTHTIEGNSIDYTRFTNNQANRGATLIKIIF